FLGSASGYRSVGGFAVLRGRRWLPCFGCGDTLGGTESCLRLLFRLRWRGRGRVGRDVEIDPEDGTQVILRQGTARGSASSVGQGQLSGNQFLRIDVAQQEEQFGPTVEPAAHAIEHSGNVFAHVCPVRTAAVKSHLARQGEEAMLAVGYDSHHL